MKNYLRQALCSIITLQFVMQPLAQAEARSDSSKKLLNAAANLALVSNEPEIGSPLVDDLREQGYYSDIRTIIGAQTRIEAMQTYRDMPSSPITIHHSVEDKYRSVVKRLALEQSLNSLFVFSTLTPYVGPLDGIDRNTISKMSSTYPSLAKVLETYSRNLSISDAERKQIWKAAVEAIIWKGFEIGAIAEQSGKYKEQVLKIEQELPNASEGQRTEYLRQKDDLTKKIYVLDVEVDRRISEQPLFAFLTLSVQSADHSVDIPLYAYLRDFHNTHVIDDGANAKIETESKDFNRLRSEVLMIIKLNSQPFLWKVQSFITSIVQGGDETLAPLTALRLDALEHIQLIVEELRQQNQYGNDQPTMDDFSEVNQKIENDYGFEAGKYNAYTAENLVNVITTGIVAAELYKLAGRVAFLKGAQASVQAAITKSAEKLVEKAGSRFIVARVAGWGARSLTIGSRFLGPVGWVASSLPLVYDLKKGYDRKTYRKFLKNYIPEAFAAGVVGIKFAEYAQGVDDRIIDIHIIAECVTTLVMMNRYKGVRWAEKLVSAGAKVSTATQLLTRWSRWSRLYKKSHFEVLGGIISNSISSVSTMTSGAAKLILKSFKGLTAKGIVNAAKRNGSHLAFIGGSIAMGFDSHFVNQGYGHVFWGVPKRAWVQSDNTAEFFESLGQQFRHAFLESAPAQIDIVSIGVSDAILTFGATNPNMTQIQLGHYYGWVAAGTDFVGQATLAFLRQDGEHDMQKAIDAVDWQRALIHYSFVSTFSTWKHLALYVPILNRALQPLVRKTINGPFLRTMVRASESQMLSRKLALVMARNERGSALWLSKFMLSLGSNWVGNTGFIEIAAILKKNSSDVPTPLEKQVIEKAKMAFNKIGLEWNEQNILQAVSSLQAYTNEVGALKSQISHALVAEEDAEDFATE